MTKTRNRNCERAPTHKKNTASAADRRAEVMARINAYLWGGGLWNPELALHDNVRDLLIDCHAVLSEQQTTDARYSRPSLPLAPNDRL